MFGIMHKTIKFLNYFLIILNYLFLIKQINTIKNSKTNYFILILICRYLKLKCNTTIKNRYMLLNNRFNNSKLRNKIYNFRYKQLKIRIDIFKMMNQKY